MTKHDRYDVLIVGGGLVGASLAAALAPLPIRVAVVEAVPFGSRGQPSFDDRATALSWGSRRIFESLGCWSGLEAEAAPIRRIHVSERGRFGATRLDAAEAKVDALGYVVPNRAIGRALNHALKDHANVAFFAPAKLKSFRIGTGAVDAEVERETSLSIRATLLAAADGAKSEIREQLGIAGEVRDYGQTAVICNIEVEHPEPGTAYERFTGDGPFALLPQGGARYGLVWTVKTDEAPRVLALDDAAFLASAGERFGARLGHFLRAGKRQSYPLSQVQAEAQSRERVVIIGNAAHSLHPIAGQGFNLSLRDVAVLAESVADGGKEGKDIGAAERLEAYVDARKRDQQTMALFTDNLNRVFANPLGSVAWARNAGLLALEFLPSLRQVFLRRNLGVAGHLPRLARGLPLA